MVSNCATRGRTNIVTSERVRVLQAYTDANQQEMVLRPSTSGLTGVKCLQGQQVTWVRSSARVQYSRDPWSVYLSGGHTSCPNSLIDMTATNTRLLLCAFRRGIHSLLPTTLRRRPYLAFPKQSSAIRQLVDNGAPDSALRPSLGS